MENYLLRRKQIRMPEYNYSSEGLYFITICTQNRQCILSHINYTSNSLEANLELLPFGKITEKYINSINDTYDDIKITDYVIMPNHVHFICSILVGKSDSKTSSANKRLPSLISTFKRFINNECNKKIWQRNYYEHIIRNEKDYIKILEYIKENPYNWKKDTYFS